MSREWAATVEWLGSEGTVEKVRKEDWKAAARLNNKAAAVSRQMASHKAKPVAEKMSAGKPQSEVNSFKGEAVSVKAGVPAASVQRVARPEAVTSAATGRSATVARPAVAAAENIVNMPGRRNRQNISYQLRLGSTHSGFIPLLTNNEFCYNKISLAAVFVEE
jgi:hypothetical protein